MKITDFGGKDENICILGFGKEGRAMLRALEIVASDESIWIADMKEDLDYDDYPVIKGAGYLEEIDQQQFWKIIKSPGVPPHPLIEKWKKEGRLTTPTEIFFDSIKDSGAIMIGVTGSKGKSTTASLIYEILNYQFSILNSAKAYLIGNIGEPAISHIADAKKGTIFVMEMSSYQLMDLQTSPQIAVVTSFFPEHLDYHGSLMEYMKAKQNITRHQSENDYVFFCSTSVGASEIAKEGEGTKIPFDAGDAPVAIEETHLLGTHNHSNIAGAWKVAERFGVDEKAAIDAIKNFRGLPHRLENIGTFHGITWVDDAISTTPESAIAALDALGDSVTTMILGGQDRGYDFEVLGQRIAASKIKTIILFPGSGPAIKRAIEEAKAKVEFFDAESMEAAVRIAKQKTCHPESVEGSALPSSLPICLLSTASPSYGMFKNFEEKGDAFRMCIEKP